jgi:Flp pilus assembly secretin CpaC
MSIRSFVLIAVALWLADSVTAATPARGQTKLHKVHVGSTITLAMPGGKEIDSVAYSPDMLAVRKGETSVEVMGRCVGRTCLCLRATDGTVENLDVEVGLDIAFIENLLRRAAPGATISVEAVTSAQGFERLLIEGNPGRAENVNVILWAAETLVGPNAVVDCTHLDSAEQVHIDLVLVAVRGDHAALLKRFAGADTPLVHDLSRQGAAIGDGSAYRRMVKRLSDAGLAMTLCAEDAVTRSGRSIELHGGDETAMPANERFGGISRTFFHPRVVCEPRLLPNGKIGLSVEIEHCDLSSPSSSENPRCDFNHHHRVNGRASLKAGQTLVIVMPKVVPVTPAWLGEAPRVAKLLDDQLAAFERSADLVLLITPRLERQEDPTQ